MFEPKDTLLTDLYQLTMMQAYFKESMHEKAVFELFIRRMPANRQFFLTMGLTQVLEYLQQLHFSKDEIEYLRSLNRFDEKFLDYLTTFRFTGDVYAMPEGTVAFENEPIVQIIAPILEAQLIESRLINLIQYQTLIATKAARCVLALEYHDENLNAKSAHSKQLDFGRGATRSEQSAQSILVDFGMRRAHGLEASVFAARASYLAGFAGTATVLAGKIFNIPLYGTMAHSYIQAHDDEKQAFIEFARSWPDNVVLLIDTYDTERGAKFVVEIANELKKENIFVKGVRIDSGDLAQHAKLVREILDNAGLQSVTIFASGDLDEYKILELKKQNAPIEGFGVGTRLNTSADLPSLDCVYKLQEYAGKPKRKCSENKETWPGRKQVYRFYENNVMTHDVITTVNDVIKNAKPLLTPFMQNGKLTQALPTMMMTKSYVEKQYDELPKTFYELDASLHYVVNISDSLRALVKSLK